VRVSRAHTPAPSFMAHDVRRTKSYLRLWGHDAVLCYAPHGAMLGESRGEGFGFFAPPPRAAAATGCSKSNDTPALVVVAPVGARDAQQPRARLRLRGVQFHGLTPSAPPVVPQPLFPVSFRCDIALMVLASPNSPPHRRRRRLRSLRLRRRPRRRRPRMMGCAHHPPARFHAATPLHSLLPLNSTPLFTPTPAYACRISRNGGYEWSTVLRKERLPKRSNKKKLIPSCTLLN
jgi:hypothetical protein